MEQGAGIILWATWGKTNHTNRRKTSCATSVRCRWKSWHSKCTSLIPQTLNKLVFYCLRFHNCIWFEVCVLRLYMLWQPSFTILWRYRYCPSLNPGKFYLWVLLWWQVLPWIIPCHEWYLSFTQLHMTCYWNLSQQGKNSPGGWSVARITQGFPRNINTFFGANHFIVNNDRKL